VPEKAFFGADLARGIVRVRGSKPGMSQALAALIAGSTPFNVCTALKRMQYREEILTGALPLRPVHFCISLPTDNWEPVAECEEVAEIGIESEHAEKEEVGIEPPPAHVQVIDLREPSDNFLVRLAKAVGATRWLNAGVAADL
jgi:hypothetical protein